MENNQTPSAKTPKPIAMLPYRSQQIDDPEANYDVSVWRSEQNLCEFAHEPTACDTLSGLYYGSAEDEVTKFCPRHFYGMHGTPCAPYRLVEGAQPATAGPDLLVPPMPGEGTERGAVPPSRCLACGTEADPWGFGMPLEEALEHQLASVRFRAQRKRQLDRYPSLRPEQKIRLALEILHDVNDAWDQENLAHYPEDLPSFDEFLAEIGEKLCDIRWNHD